MTATRRYPLVYPPAPTPEQLAAEAKQKRQKRWKPKGPFPFFRLPAELRARILECVFLCDHIIDLEPTNHRRIAKRLELFLASKQLHAEAYPIFYGRNTFRLFPIHRDFFKTESLLTTRLPPHYRAQITTLEMRLGPGWADPPACWTLGFGLQRGGPRARKDKSGLEDCTRLRTIRVFSEVDPSHPVFAGFRIDESFYTVFCGELLRRALLLAPAVATVEFDAWSSVAHDGPLMRELRRRAADAGVRVVYGPLRGWRDEENRGSATPPAVADAPAAEVPALEVGMAAVSLRA